MKRSGFTMIELIFVIVILGILASVAIPKLAATRDDAQITKALSEASTLVREMGSYYTAQGTFAAAAVGSMTNSTSLYDDAACGTATTAIASGTTYYYCTDNAGTLEDCLTLAPVNTNGVLTVSAVAAPAGNICIGIQGSSAYTNDLDGAKQFGGSSVNF